jgi:hypothetical protein
MEMELSPADRAELHHARALLGNPGLAMRITNLFGASLEKGFALLPQNWSVKIAMLSSRALEAAVQSAVLTIDSRQQRPAATGLHRIMAAGIGAAGGFWGLPALALELPLVTTIMMRSIADIARSEGHTVTEPDVKVACIEVFAFGGPGKEDDGLETGYFAVRAGLAQTVAEATRHFAGKGLTGTSAPVMARLLTQVSSRFGVQVSEKIAAQALPVIGALGGAAVNTLFIGHFQAIARGHFILLRLEKKYGLERIRRQYQGL